MKIALIGNGKMGQAVSALAEGRGHEIVAVISGSDNRNGEAISQGHLARADVAIEFTEPAAAVKNIEACMASHTPLVVGTTGWYDRLDYVRTVVAEHEGSVVWAPNFAVGVVLFTELVRRAGELFASAGFGAHLVETHHAQKRDKPSGTALAIGAAFAQGGGADLPTTSVRVGNVPGTHELHLDGAFEHVRLEHQARDRSVFAAGALRAAEWLPGRQGIFTMHDVMGLKTSREASA